MKYIRRFTAFFAKKAVLLTLCAALLIYAFYLAFNLGNAYIIIQEGMHKRVEVCLTRDEYSSLNQYFTIDFLRNDPVLNLAVSEASPFYPYTVTHFEYKAEVSKLRWHPTDKMVTCLVTETVTGITGSSKTASLDAMPTWKSGRYEVVMRRQSDGRWKIVSIVQDPTYRDVDT